MPVLRQVPVVLFYDRMVQTNCRAKAMYIISHQALYVKSLDKSLEGVAALLEVLENAVACGGR